MERKQSIFSREGGEGRGYHILGLEDGTPSYMVPQQNVHRPKRSTANGSRNMVHGKWFTDPSPNP